MDRPLFRTDLLCKAVDAGGQRFVDVTDPGSGSSYRLYELEYAVACAMDGTRALPDLASWASSELGIEPEPSELETVISTLHGLGYLSELMDFELGAYTANASASSTAAAASSARDVARDDTAARSPQVELGSPGRSPAFARPHDSVAPSAPAADIELGRPGVPAEAPPRVAASADVELGMAGKSNLADADAHEMPTVVTTPKQAAAVRAAVARDEARDDVAMDLSAQFEVKPSDVKEALRQSRAFQAVAADYGDDEPMTINSMMRTVEPGVESGVGAEALASGDTATGRVRPVVLPAAPVRSGGTSGAMPAVKREPAADASRARPAEAAGERSASVTDPPPSGGRAARNIVILVSVLAFVTLGFIYLYLAYFSDKVGRPPAPRGPRTVAGRAAGQPVAAAPPRASAVLTAADVEPVVVAATQAGVVAWVAERGASIAAGEPLVKLAGVEVFERELERSRERLKVYQDAFDQAAARNDKAGMKAAEIDVKRKHADIEKASTRIKALVVAAPVAGIADPSVAARARVALGAELATLSPRPALRASIPFAPGGAALPIGTEVTLAVKGDARTSAVCRAVAAESAATIVECPGDGPLAVGTEVLLP